MNIQRGICVVAVLAALLPGCGEASQEPTIEPFSSFQEEKVASEDWAGESRTEESGLSLEESLAGEMSQGVSGPAPVESSVPSGISRQGEDSSSASSFAVAELPDAKIRHREPEVEDGRYLLGMEREILALINADREAQSLPALIYSQPLRYAGRILVGERHNEESRANWTTVFDDDIVMRLGGQSLVTATHEYFGDRPSMQKWAAQQYFEALQRSSDYSALMDPTYTHIGVGVLTVKDYNALYEYVAVIAVHA